MKAYPVELRVRVVEAIDRGEGTWAATAARFRVSVGFVNKLLRQRRQTGSIEPRRGWTGSRPALDARAAERLRKAVSADPDATLDELRRRARPPGPPGVQPADGVPVPQAARVLSEKKSLRASERDREDVRLARRDSRRSAASIAPWRLVFLDESGVRTDLARTQARAPRGERVWDAVPHGRWKTVTPIAAERSRP